jgi:hypothetical protein
MMDMTMETYSMMDYAIINGFITQTKHYMYLVLN